MGAHVRRYVFSHCGSYHPNPNAKHNIGNSDVEKKCFLQVNNNSDCDKEHCLISSFEEDRTCHRACNTTTKRKDSLVKHKCIAWLLKLGKSFLNPHLFRNTPFMCYLFSTAAYNFALSVCAMHLPNYMVIHGASEMEVTAIMTCFSLSNLVGRCIGMYSL